MMLGQADINILYMHPECANAAAKQRIHPWLSLKNNSDSGLIMNVSKLSVWLP